MAPILLGLDKINVNLSVASSHLGWGKVLYATLLLPPCATRCPHHPFQNQEEQVRYAISRLRQRCTSCPRKDAPRRQVASQTTYRRSSLPSSSRLATSEKGPGATSTPRAYQLLPGVEVPSSSNGLAPGAPPMRPEWGEMAFVEGHLHCEGQSV